jgi:threonine/homoserine/homoserine lactone efflux protein
VNTTLAGFFSQGAALGFAAAAMPGPFQAFLVSESLVGGYRRGGPIAFAPLLSDAPIIVLALTLLEQLPPSFERGVSLVGGLFVLYTAWGLGQRWRSGAGLGEEDETHSARGGGLRRGAVINMMGPGPYLFWTLVTGPLLLSALRQSIWHGGAFLLGFYGLFIGSLLLLVVLFHQVRRLGPRVVRALLLLSVVILIYFGGQLLKRGVSW